MNQDSNPIYMRREETLDLRVLFKFGVFELGILRLFDHVDSQLLEVVSLVGPLVVTVCMIGLRHLHELVKLREEAQQVGVWQIRDPDVLVLQLLVVVEHVLYNVGHVRDLAQAHVVNDVVVRRVICVSQVYPIV